MAVEPIAAQHAERQVALARRTAGELARMWRLVNPARIKDSWVALLPQALAVLGTSQATAAASAGLYVDDVLEAQGMVAEAAGRVEPAAFAGIASDGRPLASLLLEPPIEALKQIGRGVTPVQALKSGAFLLDMITRTQVADAGRTAVGTAIAARPEVGGYVRMVVGKTCSRCLILAGRRYRWNAGFARHPRCDCRHVPVAESVPDDVRVNPRAYFDSLNRAEQDHTFGKAGAEAIRSGADMAQVVNARRGMQTAEMFGRKVQITTEGTTTRGFAGNRLGARETVNKLKGDRYRRAQNVRLMPEQIFKDAKDREDAIRLLQRHGYITRRPAARPFTAPRPAAPLPQVRIRPPRPATLGDKVAAGVTDRRPLGGGMSAQTELVTLRDGSKAVYKKASDNMGSGEPAAIQQDAEELGALVARTIGLRAPEVFRASLSEVYMTHMPGTVAAEMDEAVLRALQASDEGARLGLADLLMGNADRNDGNLLVDGGRISAIDHGSSFLWHDKFNAPGSPPPFSADWFHPFAAEGSDVWKAKNPLSAGDVQTLRDRLAAIRPEFARLGHTDWYDGMLGRLNALAAHATGRGLL